MGEPKMVSGDKLLLIRKSRLMSRAQVARGSGIAPATIRRIEKDEFYNPHRATILKLTRFYGVNLEDVLIDDLPNFLRNAGAGNPTGDNGQLGGSHGIG